MWVLNIFDVQNYIKILGTQIHITLKVLIYKCDYSIFILTLNKDFYLIFGIWIKIYIIVIIRIISKIVSVIL